MVVGLFLDSMTTNFQNKVMINEQVEGSLKKYNKQRVDAGILQLLLQEQRLLPRHRHAQSDQKVKQKQISQKNKDREMRRPRNDPIPISYAHLLPILVNIRTIVPKQIEPARFPYSRKYGPHAIYGYHVGHSI